MVRTSSWDRQRLLQLADRGCFRALLDYYRDAIAKLGSKQRKMFIRDNARREQPDAMILFPSRQPHISLAIAQP